MHSIQYGANPAKTYVPRNRRLRLSLVLAANIAWAGTGCIAMFSFADQEARQAKEQPWLAALLLNGAPTNISGAPVLHVAPELQFPADALQVKPSGEQVPLTIDGSFVPVGTIYNVGPEDPMSEFPHSLRFDKGDVQMRYTYNEAALRTAGLTEEFAAYYFDSQTKTWNLAKSTTVDASTNEVTVSTDHMTPFVLTAVPPSNGNLASAPSCIAQDYPGGIGGSAGAQLAVLGAGFRYLKDRNYTIVNDQTFNDLGFEQALGVATCNGDSICGTFAEHKLSTGSDYIVFTAHTNLDVYLMYDTRGAATLTDASKDAPWIASAGFQNTGRYITTTDAVGRFRVYKKFYAKGDVVRLHGNRQGVTSARIQANYWLALKRAGVSEAANADLTCGDSNVTTSTLSVTNLRGIPGATRVTLLWQNPDDSRFGTTVVRRSIIAPPSLPTDGISVSGSAPHAQAFVDTSATLGTVYYYTVFTVDQSQVFHRGQSVAVRTDPDADGDGLADSYETTTTYATTQKSAAGNTDSDSDGTSDYDEVVNGTDPTNGDATPPTVTAFTRTSSSPTTYPVVNFTLAATDNTAVTHYMLTSSGTAPRAWDSRWVATAPSHYEHKSSGTHELHSWARDAAGNVSASVPVVSVQIDGIKASRWAYVPDQTSGGVKVYSINAASGALTNVGSVAGSAGASEVVLAAHGRFLYVENHSSISVYSINQASGALAHVQTLNGPGAPYPPANGMTGLSINSTATELWATTGYFNQSHHRWAIDATDGTIGLTNSFAPYADVPHLTLVHPANNLLFVAYHGSGLLRTSALPGVTPIGSLGGPNPPHGLALHPLGRFLFVAGSTSLSVYDLQSGVPALHQTIATGNNATGIGIEPSGRFVYVANHDDSSISVYSMNAATGTLTAIQTYVIGAGPGLYRAVPDAAGRFLYVTQSANPDRIHVLTIDSATGQLSGSSSVLTGHDVYGIALYSEHSANDPPVATAGQERWAQMGSGPVALHGHNSYDPDAVACSANKANYVISWSFVSVPGGSARVDNDIVNRNSLRDASFTPDVAGDYVLRLSFTDDPGSCAGGSRTGSATVKIKAGYFHTQIGDYETDNGTLADILGNRPNPNAAWSLALLFPIDYGINSQWSLFKADFQLFNRICRQAVQYLQNICLTNAAALIFPPAQIAATAACYYAGIVGEKACDATFLNRFSWMNTCNSPLLPMGLGWAHCNGQPVMGQIPPNPYYSNVEMFRAHFFIHVLRRWRQQGHWSWWDYN